MNAVQKTDPEGRAASLWLELTLEGATHTFELDANETRAVAVGSLLRADLRIDRPGVAPVHFHIEREHGALWIVPAYGNKDLRVNAVRLTGPRRIDKCGLIEFANLCIDARVVERHSASVSTPVGRCSAVEWKEGSEAEAALLFGQTDSQERVSRHGDSFEHGAILTAPVQSFLSPPPRSRDQLTQTMSPSSFRGAPPPPRRKAIQPPSGASHELRNETNQGPATLRTGQALPVPTAPSTDSRSAPLALLGHDTVVMPPFWIRESDVKECGAIAGKSENSTGVHAAGQPSQTKAKRKAATLRGVDFQGLELLHRIDSGHSPEVLKPPVAIMTLQGSGNAAQNWVARLGLYATRRPLLVWLVGAALAFIVAGLVAIVGKQLPFF